MKSNSKPTDLERVALAAVAVLDSECGIKSLAELASAVRVAGFGDFTGEYPHPA